MTHAITDAQTSSLVFYSLPNYAGNAMQAVHGQTGIVASSDISWAEQSVSVPGSDNMFTFLCSGVDTGNPALSYTGHVEQYITASLPDIAAAFPAPQYPLQFLAIDAALAVPVFVQLSGDFIAQNCFAASSLVPGSSTTVATFVSSASQGALAFIQRFNGASTLASLTIGTLDETTGTVAWSEVGSVMLVYSNDTLNIFSVSGLPAGWNLDNPVQQPDGSWLIDISDISLPATAAIASLTCDKVSIENNGTDTATFTAIVTDSASGLPIADVAVEWNTTLGSLSASASITNSSGAATVSLTDTGDIGTATVMARISNGSTKSQSLFLLSMADSALLYSETRYQGDTYELKEHDSVQVRTQQGQWLWRSARINADYLLSRTVISDKNTFNYWTYADNVNITDVADITTNYSLLTSSQVEATALGRNDIIIRGTLVSDDADAALVACAVQTWPSTFTTASHSFSGKSNNGILAIIDKTQNMTAISLSIGTLDSAGMATWLYNTSLIATWDNVKEMPVVSLASGESTDLLPGPVVATDTSAEYTLSLFVKNLKGSISRLVSNKNTLIINGRDTALITATVVDSQQQPLQNTPVIWTATSGNLSFQSTETDAQGHASTTLRATKGGAIIVTAALENGDSKSVTINTITARAKFPQFIATNVKRGSKAGTISFELITNDYPGGQHYVFRFYTPPLSGTHPGSPTTILYLTDTAAVYLTDTARSVTSTYIQQNASTAISGSDYQATLHIIVDNLNLATSDWNGGTIRMTISYGFAFDPGPDIYIPAM